MTQQLGGVLVAAVTPFDRATGELAPVAHRTNARAFIERGAAGVLAAGSTGEAPMLSADEARRSVGWLRDELPEGTWLLTGAGRESTRAAIAACRDGAAEGADAALIRGPSYYAPWFNQAAMVDYFRAVADESPIPILVYNIPQYTHFPLSDALMASLTEHPNILGAKDSSGDLKNFAAYRDAAPQWRLFVGSGALLYAALELGAAGGILGVANFATTLASRVYRAFEAGEKADAGAVQETLTPLHQAIVGGTGPAGVKYAMDLVGLDGGATRPPLPAVGDREQAAIERALRAADLVA